ncbi:MAG: YitT family protein [Candidatus Krumholzibacteriia bacterium]
MLRNLIEYLEIVAGALISAAALGMFLIPNQVVAGGVTGLSIILEFITPLTVGTALLLLNLPILWLGWRYAGGRRFFLRTLVGLVTLAAGTDLLRPLLPVPTTDRLLIIVYGGLMSGLGLALVFMGRGTTGGADVLARLANQWFGVSVGRALLALNVVIYSVAGLLFGPEPAMVALLLSYVMARTMDAVLHGISATRAAFIVTDRPDEVRDIILGKLGRGATILPAEGGFAQVRRSVLFVVVARADVQRLKRRIGEADAEAFVTILVPSEVQGGYPFPRSGT